MPIPLNNEKYPLPFAFRQRVALSRLYGL